MEVGPSQHKPKDNDDGEGEIIEDTTELPKAEGVGEEGAERIRRGLGKSWGLRWER
jgi:hypothetical protein